VIFTEIEITNFRVYRGTHKLVLAPPGEGRSIYLIGGLNGAGKTSLFSAVALGLYGEEAEGLVFEGNREAYVRYLQTSLSHSASVAGEAEMRVRVEGAHSGDTLDIERTWWFERGRLHDENVSVWVGGRPLQLEGVETEEQRTEVLKEFLDELAPARVGKFFFFDGEEIRRIAEREPTQAVVEGLNQLLGFQTLSRTLEDLTTLRRTIQRETPGASSWGLDQAMEELESAEADVRRSRRLIKDLEAELAAVNGELAVVEAELRSTFGGTEVQNRSEALDALARLEREVAATAAEIQLFVTEVLVLALPGRLLQAAARRAAREAKARRLREARRQLRTARDEVWKRVVDDAPSKAPALSSAQIKALAKRFEAAWATVVEGEGSSTEEWLMVLSTEDLERLVATSRETRGTARRELQARLNRRTHLEREILRLREAETLIDSNARVQLLLETKSRLVGKTAQQEQKLAAARAGHESFRHELASKRAAVARLEEMLRQSDRAGEELATIARLQEACREFGNTLRQERATALAETATEMVAALAHKEDLISSLEIDPETFEIRMFEKSGEEVDDLSAGEREVFALSLVWALGRISQRELPVMIDTPLGRLDQMHRANVVREFFPRAGGQVLILSTDSEIDERWHELLRDHVVEHVTIEHDDLAHQSSFRPGAYFDILEEAVR
jgi:DNA sulfur modification protein DndD